MLAAAERGFKLYLKTRPPAAPESAKRAKQFPKVDRVLGGVPVVGWVGGSGLRGRLLWRMAPSVEHAVLHAVPHAVLHASTHRHSSSTHVPPPPPPLPPPHTHPTPRPHPPTPQEGVHPLIAAALPTTAFGGLEAQAGLAAITAALRRYRPSATVFEAEVAAPRMGEGAGVAGMHVWGWVGGWVGGGGGDRGDETF
jgi:hypothetical protein